MLNIYDSKKQLICSFPEYRTIKYQDTESSVKWGISEIGGTLFVLIHFDYTINSGTIGCKEGEIIYDAFSYATKDNLPVISFVASAGMRINEGVIALMQMPKIAFSIREHSKNGLLYVAVVMNPTLGGTSSVIVSPADIIVMEESAIYGFSGRRIVEKTDPNEVPEGFQSSTYVKQNGLVDITIGRTKITNTLRDILLIHEL